MILAREVSVWADISRQPNHTYILDDAMTKVYAYFKWNDPKEFMMFKRPMSIDTRYRKFQVIKRGYNFVNGEKNTNRTWLVKGSKGHEYHVEETENGMSCSCIGFKYHGKCKHIDEVSNESA